MSEPSSSPAQDPAPPRKPSRAARILTPIVVVIVMLVVVEVFLRVFAPLPYSSRLWWVPDGHIKARLEHPQEPVNTSGNPIEINALGFRGPMPEPEPEPGTLRVLVFGGSAAFCYDASDDAHTWPALLEDELAERLGQPVEVVNLGLPGFDTSNSKVNYLFTGRSLSPHAIVVYHTWNDMKFLRRIERAERMPREVLSGLPNVGNNLGWAARAFWPLQIVQRGRRVVLRIRDRRRENTYTSLEEEGSRAHRPVSDEAWGWFRQNFQDIAAFAEQDGVLPVLVSQATLATPSVVDDEERRLAIQNTYVGMTIPRLVKAWKKASGIIEDVAQEREVPFVEGYGAVPADFTHFKDHVHLRDPGTEKLAARMAEVLANDPQLTALADRVRRGEHAAR